MHNQESGYNVLWDVEIQTDHLISARRPYLVIVNNNKKKRTNQVVYFTVPADHRVKILKIEKRDK